MDFEIELMPVGDASKAGDCIVIRYGTSQRYEVMIVDGGTRETGENVVSHLRRLCGDNVVIAHAVCTHPDSDHSSGLRDILENIRVQNLWMHVPWVHASEARPYFADKRFTDAGLSEKLRKEYDILDELDKLASAQGTVIREPFQGDSIGPFRVLTPDRYSYVRLLPQFDRTPDADQQALEADRFWLGKQKQSLLGKIIEKARSWIDERWDLELLRDDGVTSATNETSTVLYGDFGDRGRVLLTADAGTNALSWAAKVAERNGIILKDFNLFQIPHHGSRSNVGPTVLNRLVGPRVSAEQRRTYSFISCPKDDETHPRKIVVNAFLRRCVSVQATQGQALLFTRGFPARPGYVAAPPLAFSSKVEDYD